MNNAQTLPIPNSAAGQAQSAQLALPKNHKCARAPEGYKECVGWVVVRSDYLPERKSRVVDHSHDLVNHKPSLSR